MKSAWLILLWCLGIGYLSAHTQNQMVEQAQVEQNFHRRIPTITDTETPQKTATPNPRKSATSTATATATPTKQN